MIFKRVVIVLCLFLWSCATPVTQYPDIDQTELERERQKQQEIYDKREIRERERNGLKFAEQKERLVRVSTKILQGGVEICNKIVPAQYGCIYDFELTDEKEVNAYADGKKIYLTQGMMNFTDTEEELAVVLGHEYAHNIMGHVAAKQKNVILGSIIGMAMDTVASSQGVETGSAFGKLGTQAGAMQYSQEFEKEADYVGLYVTYLAGYSISEAPEFWRKMSLRDERAIKNAVTHPTNPERYIGLDKTIREIRAKEQRGEPLLPNIKVE